MAFTSANMGLTVWDLPEDPFSRSALANNWTAVDRHDHSAGRGQQIGTLGIQNNAITTTKLADQAVETDKLANDSVTESKLANDSVAGQHIQDEAIITDKLANNSVTTAKLFDNAVTTVKIADAAVTNPKLDNDSVTTAKVQDSSITEPKLADNAVSTDTIVDRNVTEPKLATPAVDTDNIYPEAVTSEKLDPNLIPVGTVISWYRPSDLTPVPEGWVVPVGQTLLAGEHDFAENVSIALPDLRNRFILGAATSGTGSGTGSPPPIGQTGGSNSANLAHSHTVNSHSHVVNSHSHSISSITHRHYWFDEPDGQGIPRDLEQRGTGVYNSGHNIKQTLFVPNLNFNAEHGPRVTAPMSDHTHDHNGATGSSAPGTSSSSPGTNSQLSSSQDIRPRHIGLLFLMKVKH